MVPASRPRTSAGAERHELLIRGLYRTVRRRSYKLSLRPAARSIHRIALAHHQVRASNREEDRPQFVLAEPRCHFGDESIDHRSVSRQTRQRSRVAPPLKALKTSDTRSTSNLGRFASTRAATIRHGRARPRAIPAVRLAGSALARKSLSLVCAVDGAHFLIGWAAVFTER